MSEKWNKHNKNGYLKIHVAVDIKTKEIIVLEVRKNSVVSPKNNRSRNKEVRLQTKDHLKWKKKKVRIKMDE